MANQYVINAGLRLGVTAATVSPVISSLKKQFAANPINVPVNLKISQAAIKSISTANTALQGLNHTLQNITKSASSFNTQITTLSSRLSGLRKNLTSVNSSAQTFSRLSAGANKATSSVNSTSAALARGSRNALTFGEAIGVATRRLGAFAPSAILVYGLGGAFIEATKAALDFDSELVRLKQVGGDSERVIASIANTVTKLSTSLGTSSGDLIKSAVTLRQAGLSANDTRKALEALGKTTLSASFDNLSNTTEGVIAVLAQFKGGAGQLEQQLGSISKVSADYAVESSDLVEAIKRMGGAFSTTGGNLNELLAVFTAVRATTRESAESISTGIRTITARMQSPEAEEALRGLGINIRDGNKQAISLYKSLDKISEKIKELPTTDKRFAILANALGGNRNLSRIIPLLKETDLRHKAFETAKQGEGVLDKNATIAQEKLITQLNKLKESFLELFRIVSNDASIRLFFAAITNSVSIFTAALKEMKPLIPILTTLAGIAAFRGASKFSGQFVNGFRAVKGMSSGGLVDGLPSDIRSGTDSIPTLLTPGEFVLSTADVKRMGGTNSVDRIRKVSHGVDQYSRLSNKYGDSAASWASNLQMRHEQEIASLDDHVVNKPAYVRYKGQLHKSRIKQHFYESLLASHGVDPDTIRSTRYRDRLMQARSTPLNIPTSGIMSGDATAIATTGTFVKPTSGIFGSLSKMFIKRQKGGSVNKEGLEQIQDYLNKQGVHINVSDYVNNVIHDPNLDKNVGGMFVPKTGNIHLPVGGAKDISHVMHELGHAVDYKHGNKGYASDQGYQGFIGAADEYYKTFKNKKMSSIGTVGLQQYPAHKHTRESFANSFASHVVNPKKYKNTSMGSLISSLPTLKIPSSQPQQGNLFYAGMASGSSVPQISAPIPSTITSPPNMSQGVLPGFGGPATQQGLLPGFGAPPPFKIPPSTLSNRTSLFPPPNNPVNVSTTQGQLPNLNTTIFTKAKDKLTKSFSTFTSFFQSLGEAVKKLDSAVTKATGGTSTIGSKIKGKVNGIIGGGRGKAALGVGLALGTPLLTDHFLGNADKPGRFGVGGARTGSVLNGGISGGVTGAFIGSQIAPGIGTGVGAVIGTLTGVVGSLKTFNEELKQIDLKTLGETLSSVDLSKGKLSNIDAGKVQGAFKENIQIAPERNNLLGKIDDWLSKGASGNSRSKNKSKSDLLDTIPEDTRKEFSNFALNYTQQAIQKNPGKSLKDVTKDFGQIEKGGQKFGLGDLVTTEDKQKFHDMFKTASDFAALADRLKKASLSFNTTVNELETFNKALSVSGEKLQNRQQASEVGSNALQGQISSGVNNVTVGALGGNFKHIQDFAKEGGDYDKSRQELTRIIQQVGQDTKLQGPDAGSKAQSLFKGGGAYKEVIGDQLNEVLSHEKELLKKTDTHGGARDLADKVLAQSPATAIKQTYDQGTASLRQGVDIKHAADTQRRNRQIDIDQQRGSIDQIRAERDTGQAQTNATLNPGSITENNLVGFSYANKRDRKFGPKGNRFTSPANPLYESRQISSEETTQKIANNSNILAFGQNQQRLTGIAGGGTATQISGQIASQQTQLKTAQADQEKYKGSDINKYEAASSKVSELTEGLKRSTIGLNNLANSTIKVDGAQKLLAIATSKFQGDLQSRTNDADVALFGGKKEQRDLYQKEQLTQQVQQNPALLSQLSDKQRAAVGERLKESGDQVRSFEQFDKYGRSRGVKNVSGNDTLEQLRKQYLQPTRGSTSLYNQVRKEQSGVTREQNDRISNIDVNTSVQSADAESQAKSTTENFQQYLKDIQGVINQQLIAQGPFVSAVKDLIPALQGFPREITIKRDGKLEVIINGLAGVLALRGEFGVMVQEGLKEVLERVGALEQAKAR